MLYPHPNANDSYTKHYLRKRAGSVILSFELLTPAFFRNETSAELTPVSTLFIPLPTCFLLSSQIMEHAGNSVSNFGGAISMVGLVVVFHLRINFHSISKYPNQLHSD